MKTLTTTVSYKVENWDICNLSAGLRPVKETCRFCVKTKGGYTCVLTNDVLDHDGEVVYKTRRCLRQTCGFQEAPIEARPDPSPKELTEYAVSTYIKTYKDLIKQGYPAGLAEQAAKKYVIGGK